MSQRLASKTGKDPRRRIWTGVLLSALIFPGLGQFYHKDRGRGLALMAAVLICLGILFIRIFQRVWKLTMPYGPPSLSPEYIHRMTEAVHETEGPFLIRILTIFLGIWLVGVLDAFIRAPRR